MRKGQEVQFHTGVASRPVVNGYVAGMDDFHWKVIDDQINDDDERGVVLIHKSAPLVKIHSKPSLHDEGDFDSLEKILAPFRAYVMQTFFSNGEEPSPTSTRQNRKT